MPLPSLSYLRSHADFTHVQPHLSRIWRIGVSLILCTIYAATEALDTLVLYLVSSQSLGRSWLYRMYLVGFSSFVIVFTTMSSLAVREASAMQPFLVLQPSPIALIFVIKDIIFLMQAVGVGTFAFVHNRWTRTSTFRYLALMIPIRLALVLGRVLFVNGGIDAGLCIIEVRKAGRQIHTFTRTSSFIHSLSSLSPSRPL